MKFLFLTLSFILLSGCETVDSMQQDLTELSNSVFSSSEEQPAAEDAFFKAQEAFNEADKVKQRKASLNAQQRSLWIELEKDYNQLVADPSRSIEQVSFFSNVTLADNVMSRSVQFIELIEKSD